MLSYIFASVMHFSLLRIIVALLGTGVATYFDLFKNRNIPDNFLYVFVIISALFLVLDPITIVPSLFWAILLGVFGYLFYKSGQLGSADVLIFISLAFALPAAPALFVQQTMPMPFVLSIVILSGLLLMIYVMLKYAPYLITLVIKGKIKFPIDKLFYSVAIIFMYVIITYLLFDMSIGNPMPFILLLGFIMLSVIFTNLFRDELSKLMSEELDISKNRKKLTAGDIIAIELMDKSYVNKYNIPKLLTEKDILRLAKNKVKVIAMTKLPPYLPFVFIALLFEILLGDPLYYIISSMFFVV